MRTVPTSGRERVSRSTAMSPAEPAHDGPRRATTGAPDFEPLLERLDRRERCRSNTLTEIGDELGTEGGVALDDGHVEIGHRHLIAQMGGIQGRGGLLHARASPLRSTASRIRREHAGLEEVGEVDGRQVDRLEVLRCERHVQVAACQCDALCRVRRHVEGDQTAAGVGRRFSRSDISSRGLTDREDFDVLIQVPDVSAPVAAPAAAGGAG